MTVTNAGTPLHSFARGIQMGRASSQIRGAWLAITNCYETKTHTDSYHQVVFHKLASIKLFDKNPEDVTISIVLNKFISALCDYKFVGQTPEVLDERTCLKLLNYLINPVVAFTKGDTDDELFFNTPEHDTYKFYNYDRFSTSTSVSPFGPKYIYDTTHYLIYRSS